MDSHTQETVQQPQPMQEQEFQTSQQNDSGKRHGFYLIFAVFLGWLGIHNFYVGQPKAGILKIVMVIAFFVFSTLGGMAMAENQPYIAKLIIANVVLSIMSLWVCVEIFKSGGYSWRVDSAKPILGKILGCIFGIITVLYLVAFLLGTIVAQSLMGGITGPVADFTLSYNDTCNKKLTGRLPNSEKVCMCATGYMIQSLDKDFISMIMTDASAAKKPENMKMISETSSKALETCRNIK